ncbi:Hypothetical_protein [Hexamita inflata]|uniref:Hypothetical_protein n=1 Tax=Hexamita inflata TaxID=28002 RepID=A0AA86U9Q2_9EUKA|nr:Hypothetical protein HINF_LOCUS34349 [Hexamita inflata]
MKHIQQSQSYSGKLQNSSIYLQKPFVLKNQKQETKLKEILPVTDEIHYYSAQEDILNNQTRISALNQQLEMQNGLYNRTFSNKMRDQIQFMQKNINKQLSQFESQLKKEMSLKLQDITEQLNIYLTLTNQNIIQKMKMKYKVFKISSLQLFKKSLENSKISLVLIKKYKVYNSANYLNLIMLQCYYKGNHTLSKKQQ